jgi:hypothetical protein
LPKKQTSIKCAQKRLARNQSKIRIASFALNELQTQQFPAELKKRGEKFLRNEKNSEERNFFC